MRCRRRPPSTGSRSASASAASSAICCCSCAGVEMDAELAASVRRCRRGFAPAARDLRAGARGAARPALERAHPAASAAALAADRARRRRHARHRAAADRRARAALPRRGQLPRLAPAAARARDRRARLARRRARPRRAGDRRRARSVRRRRCRSSSSPAATPTASRTSPRRSPRRCGLALHAIACEDLPANAHELEALATLWEREATLLESALLVECDRCGADRRRAALRRARPRARRARDARAGDARPRRAAAQRSTSPRGRSSSDCGSRRSGRSRRALGRRVDGVAAQFRLSARDIARTGQEVARSAGPGAVDGALWRACRASSACRLDELAQRIDSRTGWDDLVLPAAQTATPARDRRPRAPPAHRVRALGLRREERARPRHQRAVRRRERHRQDDGRRGAGERAATSISTASTSRRSSASTSARPRRTCARVFDAAEDSGAILLFDEADALFGKRSEVKDSHDRYANIEVSYLLQRMEAYRGLAILTTNLKGALDPAFQRRLRFVVHFPFPDAPQREAIWRGIFPAATPTRRHRPREARAAQRRRRQHPQHRAQRGVLRRGGRRAGRHGASAAGGARRGRQARTRADRGRDAGVGVNSVPGPESRGGR